MGSNEVAVRILRTDGSVVWQGHPKRYIIEQCSVVLNDLLQQQIDGGADQGADANYAAAADDDAADDVDKDAMRSVDVPDCPDDLAEGVRQFMVVAESDLRRAADGSSFLMAGKLMLRSELHAALQAADFLNAKDFWYTALDSAAQLGAIAACNVEDDEEGTGTLAVIAACVQHNLFKLLGQTCINLGDATNLKQRIACPKDRAVLIGPFLHLATTSKARLSAHFSKCEEVGRGVNSYEVVLRAIARAVAKDALCGCPIAVGSVSDAVASGFALLQFGGFAASTMTAVILDALEKSSTVDAKLDLLSAAVRSAKLQDATCITAVLVALEPMLDDDTSAEAVVSAISPLLQDNAWFAILAGSPLRKGALHYHMWKWAQAHPDPKRYDFPNIDVAAIVEDRVKRGRPVDGIVNAKTSLTVVKYASHNTVRAVRGQIDWAGAGVAAHVVEAASSIVRMEEVALKANQFLARKVILGVVGRRNGGDDAAKAVQDAGRTAESIEALWKAMHPTPPNKRRKPARCLVAATSGSSNTSMHTASPTSTKAGKPMRVCLPLVISISSGNSPKVQRV